MTNIRLTNQYGGSLVTCAQHDRERRQHIHGVLVASTTADPCPTCETARQHNEAPATMRAALLHPAMSHTRFRPFGASGSVYAYHYDATSPSGFMLAAGLDLERYETIEAELRGQVGSGKLSPLSPTEQR